MNDQNTLTKTFISGTFGGLMLTLVGHPFDFIKVHKQTSTNFRLVDVVKTRGLKTLYQGISIPLLGTIPIMALNFVSFEALGKVLAAHSHQFKNSDFVTFGICGALAAIPVSVLTIPGERLKCIMQTQNIKLLHLLKTMYYKEGTKGYYYGTGITLLRDIPGNAIYFATYKILRKKLEECQFNKTAVVILSGGVAGMLNWLFVIPVDTIKSRIQSSISHMTISKSLEHNYKSVRCLYSGCLFALCRAFFSNAACFLGIEFSSGLLK